MAYATRQDLRDFSISEAALRNVGADKEEKALEAASRFADGYLNARYKLPLATNGYGSDLKRVVTDIAAFMLMKSRGFSPETADADVFKGAHDEAVKWLTGVAKGSITPVGITDASSAAVNASADEQGGPFVVQVQEGAPERDDMWSGTTFPEGGGVGTPRRRGW